jgi:hypothetical protein
MNQANPVISNDAANLLFAAGFDLVNTDMII